MHVLMNQCCPVLLIVLVFLLLVLITAGAPSSTMVDDPSIKCGECPCVNPCNQQIPAPPPPTPPPPPPPPMQYCSPPPPTSIYGAAGISPPPPPRFVYVTAAPGNLYPTDDPFNLQIYSNAAHNSLHNVACAFLLVALQLLVSFGNP